MKNKNNVLRIIASICTLIWTIVIFPLLYFPADGGIVSLLLNIVVYTVSISISLVLIVFPMKFFLCAVICWIWGFLNLIDSGSNNGLWMYALGCAFAYKQGFFVKLTPIKYLLLLPPLIAVAFQYRFGIDALIASVIDLLFFLMVFMFALVLFGESLFKKNDDEPIEQVAKIDLRNLTADEVAMIKEALANKTFKAIGLDRNKCLSTIKQSMTDIYKKIGVDSKKHLVQLHKEEKLIFPK